MENLTAIFKVVNNGGEMLLIAVPLGSPTGRLSRLAAARETVEARFPGREIESAGCVDEIRILGLRPQAVTGNS